MINSYQHPPLQVQKTKSSKESPASLEDFLGNLKMKWMEKILFSNIDSIDLNVDAADVPPIIAPALRAEHVYNTEMEKKSIYLNEKGANQSKLKYSII